MPRLNFAGTISSILSDATVLNDLPVTHARASDAFDPFLGVSVGPNVRRRAPFRIRGQQYNGDLVEASRVNYVKYSTDYTQAVWTKNFCTVTPAAGLAPDGTLSATKMQGLGGGTPILTQAYLASNPTNTYAYTWSCYVKNIDATALTLRALTTLGNSYARLNFATGQISDYPYTFVALPDGWYRISVTIGDNQCATGFPFNLSVELEGNTGSVLLWEPCFSTYLLNSSPITNAGATTGSRSADTLSINLTSLPEGGLSTTKGSLAAIMAPFGWAHSGYPNYLFPGANTDVTTCTVSASGMSLNFPYASPQPLVFTRDSNRGSPTTSTEFTRTDRKATSALLTWDSTIGQRVYKNGALLASSSSVGTYRAAATMAVQASNTALLLLYWGRVLSLAEIQQLQSLLSPVLPYKL